MDGVLIMEKTDFIIVSRPYYVELYCPYCNWSNNYDYKDLVNMIGEDVYFGNHGAVDCQYCGEEIELGDVEYD